MPSIDAQGRVVIGAWACYQNFPSPGTGCTPSGSDSAVVAAFPRNGPMTFIEQDTVRQYASSSMYGIPMAIDASGAVYYVSGCSWGAEFWLARSDGTVRTTLVTGHDGSNVPAPPFTWREIDAISVNAPGEVLIDGEFDTLGHTIGKDVLMKGTSYPGHVILKEGDVLFGSTVIDITTSNDAINDLGQVAARVRTSDQRTLIVIGDPPPPPPWTYCTAGTSFHGCAAVLSSSGAPSASNQGPFTITATGLPAQTNALFFYGTGAPASLPWGNSTSYLCVAPPSQRMNPGASSGGTTAPACDGTVALEWNDYVASHPSMLGAPFAYGDDVRIQLYYRDPQSGTGPPGAMGTATSDALAFIHGY
jgi:hypothetical protein